MKTIGLCLVYLTVFNFTWGLPPVRRFGYDNEERGYNAPIGLGGFGAGTGTRGLGDHASWCPLRAREPLRPLQRLPPVSRAQGPGYFNYAPDDEPQPRYGRSQRTNTNVRQSNDFTDVDSSDMDDGVNVGGVLWPRRSTPKPEPKVDQFDVENPTYECGCDHHKVATLAKDATVAAANAATAAALAARAAARAATAAACNPDGVEDDMQNDTENNEPEETLNVPLSYRVVYPNNFSENEYQDEEANFQGAVGSDINSPDNNGRYQSTDGSGVSSQDTTGSGVNSPSNSNSRVIFKGDSNSGVNSQGDSNSGVYSQGTVRSGVNSKGTTGSAVSSRGDSNSRVYSEGTIGGGVSSQDDSNNGEYSQGTIGSGVNSKKTAGNKGNPKSSGSGKHFQGAVSGVSSQGLTGKGVNNQGALGKEMNSQDSSDTSGYSQGTSSGAYSQGTDGAANAEKNTTSELHSKAEEVSWRNEHIRDESKKNFPTIKSQVRKNSTEEDENHS